MNKKQKNLPLWWIPVSPSHCKELLRLTEVKLFYKERGAQEVRDPLAPTTIRQI